MRLRPDVPLRLSTGSFLVWVGSRKVQQPENGRALLDLASHTAPTLREIFGERPERFATALGSFEVALGAWLLSGVRKQGAGAALAGFSIVTLSLLFTAPGMRKEGSWWEPSSQGLSIAKDLWMLGAGLALALEERV